MQKVGLWIKAMRAPFFTASLVPVLVGSMVAYRQGEFSFWLFLVCLVSTVAIQAGTNMTNDYFDHVSTDDEINQFPTPFSGGSRMIQEKLLTPRQVLTAAFVAFAIAFVAGMYLVLTRGLPLLALGLTGIALGYFYTALPLQLGYRGVGEMLVGILLGPLAVLAAYYVQMQQFSASALWASLPVGLLVATILYINEFPDYDADKAVGKNHLIVLLGPRLAVKGYIGLLTATYLTLIGGMIFDSVPYWGLIAFLTIPLALKGARVALANYDNPRQIVPAQASTIGLHLTLGILLSLAFVIDRLV